MNSIFKLLTAITLMVASLPTAFCKDDPSPEKSLSLIFKVKDNVLKHDLEDAIIITFDKLGNPADSLKAHEIRIINGGETIRNSLFVLPVERKDSLISFDIVCEGYQTKSIVHHLENVGRRETERNLGVFLLERTPRQLGEVTVTATKIKFYNKGDTIVYNADAFQLAEGSMLDALINQLPGVELKDNGQITVNGELVESLLLNGKQFLDGNNQLMLDNIAAYTVKNVSIYDGLSPEEQWLGDNTRPKQLTMDVTLKREYNMGWQINAQGGYGTDNRYLGRLYASWFTPTTSISLLGNINNLNDNRSPGKNDSWTPEMLPSGTKEYKMGALNYNYQHPDDKAMINSSVYVEETSEKTITSTNRTNFLQNGNTYDYESGHNLKRDLSVNTRNRAIFMSQSYMIGGILNGSYYDKDNTSAAASATFSKEQTEMTLKRIEELYSGESNGLLETLINRSITRDDSHSREWEIDFQPQFSYKMKSGDYFSAGLKTNYRSRKETVMKDYVINFGADPTPAEKRRQYFNNSPNRTAKIGGEMEYTMRIGDGRLSLNYEYLFTSRDKDSYMYALERMADMGSFGSLPSGYIDTFDPDNSFTSRIRENRHTITPRFSWWHSFENRNQFTCAIGPKFRIINRTLDYFRGGKSYPVSNNTFMTAVGNYGAYFSYSWDWKGDERRGSHRNQLEIDYRLTPTTPDLFHMTDIVDSTDPMNISLGNPDLRNAYEHKENIRWTYRHHGKPLLNILSVTATQTTDALVRGYTYDTATGIRRNKTFNVNGNNTLEGKNVINLQFGPRQMLSLSSISTANLTNYADMIGIDLSDPVRSTVRTSIISQKLRLEWQIGKQNIEIKGEAVSRHTSSSRENFTSINASHFNYGVMGRFVLPYGFGINADFTCYSRHGYGSKELDTTDAILNIGMSFAPRKSRWVFKADGFDLLHQLSNVHYAISASGRTISYTNALPRYVLFTAQYRLNLQPKRKK